MEEHVIKKRKEGNLLSEIYFRIYILFISWLDS